MNKLQSEGLVWILILKIQPYTYVCMGTCVCMHIEFNVDWNLIEVITFLLTFKNEITAS